MANKSINQLVKIIEDISVRHKQINSFGYGSTHEIGTVKEMVYPYLWCTLQSGGTVTTNDRNNLTEINLEFTLIVADILSDVNSTERGQKSTNGLEISSDTNQILLDIISEINGHPYYTQNRISIKNDVSIDPTFDERDDNVNAWLANITISMPFDHSFCKNPIDYTTLLPIIDTNPSFSVSVLDSDEGVIITQVVDPDNNTIVISDITVTDSDGSTFTALAGADVTCILADTDLFTTFYLEAGDDVSAIVTINADSAGTYTSISDDTASGTITIDINSGGFNAFSSPLVLIATDIIQIKRTITITDGWVKLTGTY